MPKYDILHGVLRELRTLGTSNSCSMCSKHHVNHVSTGHFYKDNLLRLINNSTASLTECSAYLITKDEVTGSSTILKVN